jgi:methyltransferase FkbM-like protein
MTILNVGLDSEPRTRELHLAGPMSSLLRPDLDVWDQFGFKAHALLKSRLIKTTTLDDVVRDQHLRFVDFIKLDTQGSELDILRGGPVTIGEMALGLRIEVSFYSHYEAQPLFADLDPYVRSQGFDLIDLLHFNRKRHAHVGAVDKALLASADGQLLQADALYFRAPSRLVLHLKTMAAPDRVRYMAGALVSCLTYNKLDLAARYIHEAASLIEPRSRAVILDLLRCAVSSEPIISGQRESDCVK